MYSCSGDVAPHPGADLCCALRRDSNTGVACFRTEIEVLQGSTIHPARCMCSCSCLDCSMQSTRAPVMPLSERQQYSTSTLLLQDCHKSVSADGGAVRRFEHVACCDYAVYTVRRCRSRRSWPWCRHTCTCRRATSRRASSASTSPSATPCSGAVAAMRHRGTTRSCVQHFSYSLPCSSAHDGRSGGNSVESLHRPSWSSSSGRLAMCDLCLVKCAAPTSIH